MNKKIIIGFGVIVILLILGTAAYVLRPTPEASAPIEAIPLASDPTEPASADESDPQEPLEVQSSEELPGEATSAEAAASQGLIIFTILQDESEVRFTLHEVLRGNPTTVVGATNQVSGEIGIDPENPTNSQVGAILINARTLQTDNNMRNRAINNEILDSGEYEFITFTPTAIAGFPENPQLGEAFTLQITGDLTIRQITNPVTFEVTVTAISETRLEGHGSTVVKRADYDLVIPNVPNVADVDEEVLLEIDFVAGLK